MLSSPAPGADFFFVNKENSLNQRQRWGSVLFCQESRQFRRFSCCCCLIDCLPANGLSTQKKEWAHFCNLQWINQSLTFKICAKKRVSFLLSFLSLWSALCDYSMPLNCRQRIEDIDIDRNIGCFCLFLRELATNRPSDPDQGNAFRAGAIEESSSPGA